MSIFEYVPEFYKAQWSAQLFPFKIMILVSLVLLNSMLLSAVIRARKDLSGLSYIFLPSGMIFLMFSAPLGVDHIVGVLAITAAFAQFLQNEHMERVRTRQFTIRYMEQIAEFITMQRFNV